MDFKKFLPLSFTLSIIITVIGALFKIMHLPISTIFLVMGLLTLLIFMVLCILEISNSKKLEGTEKFMWIISFVFFGFITGLLYVLSYRKKII